MKILTYRKYLLSSVIAIMLISCNKSPVQKSQELSDSELLLQKTFKDISVAQFAELELIKAGNMLKAAAQAETKEQMATLVYIANNKINTAIKTSQLKLYQTKIQDIHRLKANLRRFRGNLGKKNKSSK